MPQLQSGRQGWKLHDLRSGHHVREAGEGNCKNGQVPDLLPAGGVRLHKGLLVRRFAGLTILYLLIIILEWHLLDMWFATARAAAPPTSSEGAINCNQTRPSFMVRSSVDSKVYRIDVCAVADSAEGEDFRTEAK
jgi:hypothetical protein